MVTKNTVIWLVTLRSPSSLETCKSSECQKHLLKELRQGKEAVHLQYDKPCVCTLNYTFYVYQQASVYYRTLAVIGIL